MPAVAHDPRTAPVPVPESLAALFRELGFELSLTARRADGRELRERDLRGLERLSHAYSLQHPTPERPAADVDLLAELQHQGGAPKATGTGD